MVLFEQKEKTSRALKQSVMKPPQCSAHHPAGCAVRMWGACNATKRKWHHMCTLDVSQLSSKVKLQFLERNCFWEKCPWVSTINHPNQALITVVLLFLSWSSCFGIGGSIIERTTFISANCKSLNTYFSSVFWNFAIKLCCWSLYSLLRPIILLALFSGLQSNQDLCY